MEEKFVCPNCGHSLTYVKTDISERIFPVDEDGVIDYYNVSLRSSKRDFARCERCFHIISSDSLDVEMIHMLN